MTKFKALVFAPFPISIILAVRSVLVNGPVHWAAILILMTGILWAALVVIGFPTHYLLKRFGAFNGLTATISGGLLLPLAFLLLELFYWQKYSYTFEKVLPALLLTSLHGAVTAFTYWYLSRVKNRK